MCSAMTARSKHSRASTLRRIAVSIGIIVLIVATGSAAAQGRGGTGSGGHGGGGHGGSPPGAGGRPGGSWHGSGSHGGSWHGGGHGSGNRWHGNVGVYFGPYWGSYWGWPYAYPYAYPYYSYPYYGYPYRYDPYPYYDYPDDYPYPAYVPQPRAYIERTPQAASTVYWYYCTDPAGYYPYVKDCSRPWKRVLPQDVAPAGSAPSAPGGPK